MVQDPREQATGAYLVIQKGPQLGKRVEVWKDCTTIGRSLECDIFLEDLAVHRKQASIVRTNDGYLLRDDHGSGDSFVNDQPIKEQFLNDGDQLLFGGTRLTFYAHEGTRPFQLASSRGHELLKSKIADAHSIAAAQLDLTSRQGITRSFELLPDMTLGRSRECDVFLEDLAVSRLHATIRQLPDGGYELVDHGSATGTYVNGLRITRYRLIEGDVVQIGVSRLIFRRGGY